MFLPNPGILAAGAGRTYEDWLAHIIGRAPATASAQSDRWPANTMRVVGLGPLTGSMVGSPWGQYFSRALPASSTRRILQHCLPSINMVDALVSSGTEILFVRENIDDGSSYSGRGRNGFTSSGGSGSGEAQTRITECSYWNPLTNKPETMDPFAQSGPVPYAYAGW